MAKVRSKESERKPKGDGGREGDPAPPDVLSSLTAEEWEEIAARARESMHIESRTAPYKMLEEEDAKERQVAKLVRKAEKEARHIAARLTKLSAALSEIDRLRRGGPLARWLWSCGPEGKRAYADALMAAVEKRPQTQQPRPWDQAPKGGPALVAKILCEAFGRTVAKSLADEAASSRTRKGGRPLAVRFNSACRLLASERRTEAEIAELLCMSKIASGPPTKVRERVRVVLNRFADPNKAIHPLAEVIGKLQRIEDAERDAWPSSKMVIGGGPRSRGQHNHG